MPIKPIRAWASVMKKSSKLDVYELYSDADKKQVSLNSDEKFIRVEIKEVK